MSSHSHGKGRLLPLSGVKHRNRALGYRVTRSQEKRKVHHIPILAIRHYLKPMDICDVKITGQRKALCQKLLDSKQGFPADSLFRDDLFRKTCRNLEDRNESRVIQDIARLIVPSAETLATFGVNHMEILTENVNEGWNESIPLVGPLSSAKLFRRIQAVGIYRGATRETAALHRQPHRHILLCGHMEDVLLILDVRGKMRRRSA